MFPFRRSATSSPAPPGGDNANNSTNNDSSFYFSRIFSPVDAARSSPRLAATPLLQHRQQALSPAPHQFQPPYLSAQRNRHNHASPVPPSLFNFQPPIRRHEIQQSPQTRQRPRPPSTPTASLMMERALRILESKRKRRSSEEDREENNDQEEAENIYESIIISEKRQRGCESADIEPEKRQKGQQNNSSPLLVPVSSSVSSVTSSLPCQIRPSSSKLPDQVSRLSSAALEAIAFGSSSSMKRKRQNQSDEDAEDGVVDLFPLPLQPAPKRRDVRDSETQTTEKKGEDNGGRPVSSSSSASSSTHLQQRLQRQRQKPSSVSRFIAGLEARARANALTRRSMSSASLLGISTPLPAANAMTPMSSLEARHASIRRLFADLAEKASQQPSILTSSPVTGNFSPVFCLFGSFAGIKLTEIIVRYNCASSKV